MDGKVAVITGSTQGLGESIAHLFADRGCEGLLITGRNTKNGARVKADLQRKGLKVVFVEADLSNIDAVREIMATCDKEFGRLDALVNSAGLSDRGTIFDTSPELFDRIFAVNVRAPFFLMQDAIHLMKKTQTRGTVVNILSISGYGGQSYISAYCSSKGALTTLTRNIAASLLGYSIRINGLNIGWMDTPGEDRVMKTYHAAEEGWLISAEAGRPCHRLLKPEEVARAVAYLSSNESGLMTGAIIDFDQQVIGAGDSIPNWPPAV
jgi:NAD(P)-dependent dehydrogenase (short-subunit alcohol dehydrogenase family)